MKKSMVLLLAFLLSKVLFAQTAPQDSLQALLKTARDTSRVNLLLELSKAHNGSDQAKAIAFAKQALEESRTHNFPKGEAYALKSLGLAYVNEGGYPEVIRYWEQSLAIFNQLGDKVGASNMLNNIGVIYSIQGWEAKAIEFYLKALKEGEESGNKLRIATALLNIGVEYGNNPATLDKALTYYLKALPLSKEIGDQSMLGTLTGNIGEIYFAQGNHKKALAYFQEALGILNAAESKDKVAYTLNNIGKVYAARGDLAKAMEQHQKARVIAKSVAAKLEETQALNYIGQINLKQNKPDQALATFQQSKRIATDLGANHELKDSYAGLAQSYQKLSDYQKAYQYQSLLLGIKDTLYNAETKEKINNLEAAYQSEKKQNQIDLLTKDSQLKQASLERQQVFRNALLAVLGLILIIAVVLFFNIRNKVKANQLLQHKNDEINAQKEELATQRDHLEKTYNNLLNTQDQLVQSEKMASLGQLTAGVAHEINNPINFVSAGIESLRANFTDIMEVATGYFQLKPGADNTQQLQKLEKLKKEIEVEELIQESEQLFSSVKNGATRTKEIVKSLKNFTRLDEDNLKKANLHEGLDSTLVILNNQLKNRIKIVRNYGDLQEVNCYPGQLNQVFMNILNNAAQAIPEEGTIAIKTYADDDFAVIKIRDTGVGMSEEVKKHIFEPFFTTKDVGEGTGLGLSISYGIIEKHKGKIEVESQPGQGTEFTIRIPLQFSPAPQNLKLETVE
ncbi:tetratricopeptide repeat-containing sensor histidine kinase [Rufibacter latericius]|uniref:histidine kinase n=1 Tax=Rufibacter latericius TaxID=2487040 RepID=A0A3M9M8T9_9BACT|nr:tetratricopeptide repeat protein [Rufibacter latericius]RNI21979.1 GHKL domain-containing protein [Rufibacter latericius]